MVHLHTSPIDRSLNPADSKLQVNLKDPVDANDYVLTKNRADHFLQEPILDDLALKGVDGASSLHRSLNPGSEQQVNFDEPRPEMKVSLTKNRAEHFHQQSNTEILQYFSGEDEDERVDYVKVSSEHRSLTPRSEGIPPDQMKASLTNNRAEHLHQLSYPDMYPNAKPAPGFPEFRSLDSESIPLGWPAYQEHHQWSNSEILQHGNSDPTEAKRTVKDDDARFSKLNQHSKQHVGLFESDEDKSTDEEEEVEE